MHMSVRAHRYLVVVRLQSSIVDAQVIIFNCNLNFLSYDRLEQ
jgi:hypothetical protein